MSEKQAARPRSMMTTVSLLAAAFTALAMVSGTSAIGLLLAGVVPVAFGLLRQLAGPRENLVGLAVISLCIGLAGSMLAAIYPSAQRGTLITAIPRAAAATVPSDPQDAPGCTRGLSLVTLVCPQSRPAPDHPAPRAKR